MQTSEEFYGQNILGASEVFAIAGAVSVVALLMLNSWSVALAIAGAAGAALILWAAWAAQREPASLLCAVLLIESFASTTVLPITEDQRYAIRYPLLLLFCLPTLARLGRNPLNWQGGFRDYWLYLLWGLLSVTHSLLPSYSLARIVAAMLLYSIIVYIVGNVRNTADITKLLGWFIVGCVAVWIAMVFSLIVMPHDLVWAPDEAGIVRFKGIFGSPNEVGEIALATIGASVILWPTALPKTRALLALNIVVATALTGLADSRSMFVSIAAGVFLYLVWRYRWRGVILIAAISLLLLAGSRLVSSDYISRGEVSTLTGRSDIWRFAIKKIEERPITGWGYEVEGQILQDVHFPIWWGPWEEGPHSSLHSGYLARAVGVGVPATAFWLFVLLRSWLSLFRRDYDPWQLKSGVFLAVIPILILNSVESTAGDCRYAVGLLGTVLWALAERQRLRSKAIAD